MKDEKWYVCECSSLEHFFVVSFDETEEWNDYVFINVYLSQLSFFQRLINGIKYIFGFKSKYGSFEEILLNKEKVQDLIERLNLYYDKMK